MDVCIFFSEALYNHNMKRHSVSNILFILRNFVTSLTRAKHYAVCVTVKCMEEILWLLFFLVNKTKLKHSAAKRNSTFAEWSPNNYRYLEQFQQYLHDYVDWKQLLESRGTTDLPKALELQWEEFQARASPALLLVPDRPKEKRTCDRRQSGMSWFMQMWRGKNKYGTALKAKFYKHLS